MKYDVVAEQRSGMQFRQPNYRGRFCDHNEPAQRPPIGNARAHRGPYRGRCESGHPRRAAIHDVHERQGVRRQLCQR